MLIKIDIVSYISKREDYPRAPKEVEALDDQHSTEMRKYLESLDNNGLNQFIKMQMQELLSELDSHIIDAERNVPSCVPLVKRCKRTVEQICTCISEE